MSPDTVYESIRAEITDQKHCQFSVTKLSMTVNAAVIGVSGLASGAGVLGPNAVFAAVVASAFAAWLVLEKAQSIQRNVGYLKLAEQYPGHPGIWRWEHSLAKYREASSTGIVAHDSTAGRRTHKYVTSVSIALMLMLACTIGSSAATGFVWQHIVAVAAWGSLGVWVWLLRRRLVRGVNSPSAIDARWREVLGL